MLTCCGVTPSVTRMDTGSNTTSSGARPTPAEQAVRAVWRLHHDRIIASSVLILAQDGAWTGAEDALYRLYHRHNDRRHATGDLESERKAARVATAWLLVKHAERAQARKGADHA